MDLFTVCRTRIPAPSETPPPREDPAHPPQAADTSIPPAALQNIFLPPAPSEAEGAGPPCIRHPASVWSSAAAPAC